MGLLVAILMGVVLVCVIAGVLFLLGFIDLVTGVPLTVIACMSALFVAGLVFFLLLAAPMRGHPVADRQWVIDEDFEPVAPPRVIPIAAPDHMEFQPPTPPVLPEFVEPSQFEQFAVDETSSDADGMAVDPPAQLVTESSETKGSLPTWAQVTDETLANAAPLDLPVATGLFPSRADCLTELDTAVRRRAADVISARRGPVAAEAIPDGLVHQLTKARHIESSHSSTLDQTMYKAYGLVKFDEPVLRQLDEVWRQQTVGSRLTNAGGATAALLGMLALVWGGMRLTTRKRTPAPAAV